MLIAAGLAFLLAGVAIYSLVRPVPIWALPDTLHHPGAPPWLARAGGSVPTFGHTAALALLTVGVLGGGLRRAWVACVAWAVVNAVFELGQHPRVRVHLIGALPEWLERFWLLDRTRGYFLNGTFDVIDIVAALLGALAAHAVIRRANRPGDSP